MPSRIPAAAGSHAGKKPPSACSIAGSSRLHTLAAVITPAAKPMSAFWNAAPVSLAKKNTIAAPSVVIRKVNPVPSAAYRKDCIM